MSLPWRGPILAVTAVVLDATIFGYLVLLALVIPTFSLLKATGKMSWISALAAFAAAGMAASQIARFITPSMRQAGLGEFSNSPLSLLLGLLCGLAGGVLVAAIASRPLSQTARRIAFVLPFSVMALCLFVLMGASGLELAR